MPVVLCLSLLFYEMQAEPDGRADSVNYTHTHTHDARITSVTSPLSLNPQVVVTQEVSPPTYYLGRTFLVSYVLSPS